MNRLKAFAMWLLYFIVPTDLYLRLNGYDPNEVGKQFETLAKRHIEKRS